MTLKQKQGLKECIKFFEQRADYYNSQAITEPLEQLKKYWEGKSAAYSNASEYLKENIK